MSRMQDRIPANDSEAVVDAMREHSHPLTEAAGLNRLVAAVSDARYVLLGEASHGTSEFYRWRARLTARLLREHDFSFVAVEGDWTDCYDVNRYVHHMSDAGSDTPTVLRGFDRWPTWMWANWEVVALIEWLRECNADRPESERAGFYGLDVYSLFESMTAVIDYLEDIDPDAAVRARDAYNCFEPYGEDAREYARSTRLVPESCEDEVVEMLSRLRERTPSPADEPEEQFAAEQNALVAKNAEEYYRAMARADVNSWNVRDEHMVETLDRLLDRHDPDAKAIVWAHNTHVGDARATDMEDRGKVNVGQLVRERNPADDVFVVGFGTHRGEVVAGEEWDAPMEQMQVPSARQGSLGDLFHRASENATDAFVFCDELAETVAEPRGHRAIGVVYDPDRELGNYVPTVLPERYDAFVHVDQTSALHPLPTEPKSEKSPEAYPWGM